MRPKKNMYIKKCCDYTLSKRLDIYKQCFGKKGRLLILAEAEKIWSVIESPKVQ